MRSNLISRPWVVVFTMLVIWLAAERLNGQRRAGRVTTGGHFSNRSQLSRDASRIQRGPTTQRHRYVMDHNRADPRRPYDGRRHHGKDGHRKDRHRGDDGAAFYGAGVGVYLDAFGYPYGGNPGTWRYDDPHLDYPRFGAYQGGGRYGYGRPYVLHPDAVEWMPENQRAAEPVEQQIITNNFVSPPNEAADSTDARPFIDVAPAARSYQFDAEQAFREHRFQDASKQAEHAWVEDPQNGKLQLFLAQIDFALGRYDDAVQRIERATTLLPPEDWGLVVVNYAEFYRDNDYVEQMQTLNDHAPQDLVTLVLQGYQYLYLEYLDAARDALSRALKIDPDNDLASKLFAQLEATSAALPEPPPEPRRTP